jgi:hypothetical protein
MATGQTSVRRTDSPREISESLSAEFELGRDILEYLREYAREKPEMVGLWCFGIGFILGWKLKPW